ncbi:BamA/TamA family outer membrane protein [Echinicola jeungdonensis]|uniref:BamA/TamA family outer membrane protein n=1 Tax=Echinicola jeungdonensis TaxID=709343 RepID=UPI0025B5C08B|nr:BamA/TamA family outer membrane protein [Echinicola jeungdonensis]MDN3668585.1 BamA/TamA family outer membrane protein [Echinicola jeungdonensis]
MDLKRFEGKPFDYLQYQKEINKILENAENQGYPFASIRLDSAILVGQSFKGILDYQAGPLIHFDTLKITGSSKADPLFLARQLKIFPGETFSQEKIDQANQRIENIPYLKMTGPLEMSFQNQEATLYLPIGDRKINSLDGIIGILPNEVERNKLLVTGQFNLALYNVGGKGRNYSLAWQRLSQYTQNLSLGAVEPMVLGSTIDLKAGFSLLKEDTTFINRDLRLDLGYQISPRSYFQAFTRWQSGNRLATNQENLGEGLPDILDFSFHNYGLKFDFKDWDDAFFPKRGWSWNVEIGLGNKNIIQNTSIPDSLYHSLDKKTLQFYFNYGVTKYFDFNSRFGTKLALLGGEIHNETLLINDLYRLGGLRSIRGFNENFFFANRFLYANFEPRFYFGERSYWLVFADAGRLENSLMIKDQQTDFVFSFGAGLSLEASGGVFNFIYALGKSNEQELGVNFSKVHFGYTARF